MPSIMLLGHTCNYWLKCIIKYSHLKLLKGFKKIDLRKINIWVLTVGRLEVWLVCRNKGLSIDKILLLLVNIISIEQPLAIDELMAYLLPFSLDALIVLPVTLIGQYLRNMLPQFHYHLYSWSRQKATCNTGVSGSTQPWAKGFHMF